MPGDDAEVDWGTINKLVTMGTSGMTVCAPDGSGARAIYTQPLSFGVLRWSPDATTIVALPDSERNHLLIDADGSNPRQLGGSVTANAVINVAEWAPSSRQLVYWENSYRTGHELIEVAPSDGSGGNVIAQALSDPVWSPRGDLVGVAGNPDSSARDHDLEVMRPDGTLARSVLHVGSSWSVHHPRFSPDGSMVAFAVYGS